MTRVAFTLIGGKAWTGGYNYLLNLVRTIAEQKAARIVPVLFFGTDADETETAPFATIAACEIVRSPVMNQSNKLALFSRSVLFGRDGAAKKLFDLHRIDVLFEAATFFGRRIGRPAIAWMPDLQHRALPQLFSRASYWKREIGFRSQIAAGREIMLSSDDARSACEVFFPTTRGRTHTVRFAVQPRHDISTENARAIATSYGLPQTFFFMPNQFWQHKNHLLVLEALALLRTRGCKAVIAASGKQSDPRNARYFPLILKKMEGLSLQDEFRILGLIPYQHIEALMIASAALLNPSMFEGWSTTVEEARGLGVPMLLSDIAVHHEQVGELATYFDYESASSLADALERFKFLSNQDRQACRQLAYHDASKRVSQFAEDFADLAEHCTNRSSERR